MNPLALASQMTGLPVTDPSSSKKKAPAKKGRQPSGKPGASHLKQMQDAHGRGDHKTARRHALNYAKETSQYENSQNAQPTNGPDAFTGEREEDDVPRGAMNSNGTPVTMSPQGVDRTTLARMAAKKYAK